MDCLVRHHLLEIMFYYDEHGEKHIITNSRKRLKELGVYDDWKLCITMKSSDHSSMHNKYRTYKRGYKQKPRTSEHSKAISEAKIGCKSYTKGHHYDTITENLSFSRMGVVGKFMWDKYGLRKYDNRQLHTKIRRYYDKHKTLEGFHE